MGDHQYGAVSSAKRKDHGSGSGGGPITRLPTNFAGFAFIDDTDLLQTQRSSTDTIVDIVDKLQGSLDTW